jgi:hypothetical protein
MTESSKVVQYVGFHATALGRDYAFSVREPGVQPREYTLTIANEAFESHRARYQDAAEICSLRLHQELAVSTNDPAATHFGITDTELAAYDARRSRPKNYL